MAVDRCVGVAEPRHVKGPVEQRGAGDQHHDEGQDRCVAGDLLAPGGERQGAEHEDRRDAGADGGFGEGHVDGVEEDEEPGREQRIDAGQHDHREQVTQAHDGKRRQPEEGEQDDVDHAFDEVASP